MVLPMSWRSYFSLLTLGKFVYICRIYFWSLFLVCSFWLLGSGDSLNITTYVLRVQFILPFSESLTYFDMMWLVASEPLLHLMGRFVFPLLDRDRKWESVLYEDILLVGV
jgi:hypothetical protein